MNGPSPLNHTGNGEPMVEKDVAKKKLEHLLTAIKSRPSYQRGLLERNIKGGVAQKPASFKPRTPPITPYTEVDQPELIRNETGQWVQKESE